MDIRPYRPPDCPEMAQLFYNTVHIINARDYTPRQLDAWATGTVDLSAWDRSFRAHRTLVAEEAGILVGFGDMLISTRAVPPRCAGSWSRAFAPSPPTLPSPLCPFSPAGATGSSVVRRWNGTACCWQIT